MDRQIRQKNLEIYSRIEAHVYHSLRARYFLPN
jgi:hypothetical protein